MILVWPQEGALKKGHSRLKKQSDRKLAAPTATGSKLGAEAPKPSRGTGESRSMRGLKSVRLLLM